MKHSPRPLFFLHQTLQLALCIWAGSVLLASAKPRLVSQTDRWWFINPKNAFPLLQNPMVVSFTPLQPTLGIAHGDLKLVWGCSAKETHFIMFLINSYCADVASRGSLDSVVSVANKNRWFLRTMRFSTRRSRSASLYYLPLRDWAIVASRRFHFRNKSIYRVDIWWTNLSDRWHPMTVPCWKSLSSSIRPFYCQCLSMEIACLCAWFYTPGSKGFGWNSQTH